MNAMKWLSRTMMLVAVTLAFPIASRADSKDVLPLQISLRGGMQTGSAIGPMSMKSKHLVNAAMNHDMGAAVPRSLVLALVHECGKDEAEIVVFDTLAKQVLADVGKMKIEAEVHDSASQVLVGQIEAKDVGLLKGGKLELGGKVLVNPAGCTSKMAALAMGSLKMRVHDTDLVIVIPVGRLRTGRKLATID